MEQGWVYVLVNPTLPGLVKVGRTARPPSTRVAELSQATGVATPFILIFEQSFADCVAAERDIHGVLDRCGMRVAPNREFFRGPTTEIVRVVLQYAMERGDEGASTAAQSGLELLLDGDRHLFGDGVIIQDLPEALRFYQMAAARGSLLAFERLGTIIAQMQGLTRLGRQRAMNYFKDGARRGNYYCYCEMAAAAAEDGQVGQFERAWELFFLHRQSAWLAEAEEGRERYLMALRRYVITSLALGVRPGHLCELRAEADALVRSLDDGLGQVLDPPGAARLMDVAFGWAKQTLLPTPSSRRPWTVAFGWRPVWPSLDLTPWQDHLLPGLLRHRPA